VQGDYADVVGLPVLNFTCRGNKQAGITTGLTSIYGTHWHDMFDSATTGKIRVCMNEPTAPSAAQCQSTALKLTVVGDQVTWTMPYLALGHTGLTNLTSVATNIANHLIEFQYDIGGGWNGTWQTANSTNLLAVGAVNPNTGVALKLRATCITANASNSLTYLNITTASDATSQQIQYPLPGIQLTLTGLVAGSDVVVLAAGTETVLTSVEDWSGTSWIYDYSTPQSIDIAIYKPGYIPAFVRGYALGSSNASLPVTQTPDPSYLE